MPREMNISKHGRVRHLRPSSFQPVLRLLKLHPSGQSTALPHSCIPRFPQAQSRCINKKAKAAGNATDGTVAAWQACAETLGISSYPVLVSCHQYEMEHVKTLLHHVYHRLPYFFDSIKAQFSAHTTNINCPCKLPVGTDSGNRTIMVNLRFSE
ncbi:hypothetical protein BDW66DRAFT_15680 [Aspergillus desertorum]